MTRQEADAVLIYITNNIISPLAFDNIPAKEVWLRLSGEDFNKMCAFMYSMTTCPICFGKPITINGKAENGCDDCKFYSECEEVRLFQR